MIFFYSISGASVFFAFILLLIILSNGTNQLAESTYTFLIQNEIAIIAVIAVIAILGGILLGRKQKWMIPGYAGNLAQFCLGLFWGLRRVAENIHDSAFMMIWEFIIYVIVMIVAFALTSLVTNAALYNRNYLLLYGGAIAGYFFHLTFW